MGAMSPNTQHWLIGIWRAATMGGNASGTAIGYDGLFGDGVHFTTDWKRYALMFLIPAAARLWGYLRRHPLPGVDIPDDFRNTMQISKPVMIVPKDTSSKETTDD